MSLPLDLLEQADHLSKRETKRPKQASLRRSVSASYYALFHLLTTDAAFIVGANLNNPSREIMVRSFKHADMKTICNFFSSEAATNHPKAPRQLRTILPAPSAGLQGVAKAFIRLQEARHDADYNLSRNWTRLAAQQHVSIARNAFAAWGEIKKTHEANIFALALLPAKLFDRDY